MMIGLVALLGLAHWQIGPFVRPAGVNPILRPRPTLFQFPGEKAPTAWESGNTFNPAATTYHGQVVLLYRAEDDPGRGVGQHRSSIGYAISRDGIHFRRDPKPVVFLDSHNRRYEDPGGCEDPRVVATPSGGYLLTYTGYDRKTARLCVATSTDLKHWIKHGPAFAGSPFANTWSKSGSIVTRNVQGRLTAAKVNGRYWMYWGEGSIHIATSTDLIHWSPLTANNGSLTSLMTPRPGRIDSALVEPGPPAVITPNGILLLYNGKNADQSGDPSIGPGAYSAGEVLIDSHDPSRVIAGVLNPILRPQEPFEMTGQYKSGTVFVEGLVPFKGKWMLYFGTADSFVGVASAPLQRTRLQKMSQKG